MKTPKPRKPPNPAKPAKSYVFRISNEKRAACDAQSELKDAASVKLIIDRGLAAGPIPWQMARIREEIGALEAALARVKEMAR
jgi:hypothetical protein